jgi:hypothetical protein
VNYFRSQTDKEAQNRLMTNVEGGADHQEEVVKVVIDEVQEAARRRHLAQQKAHYDQQIQQRMYENWRRQNRPTVMERVQDVFNYSIFGR